MIIEIIVGRLEKQDELKIIIIIKENNNDFIYTKYGKMTTSDLT